MAKFTFSASHVPEVLLIEPTVFIDNRGFFMEIYNKEEFSNNGINEDFILNGFSHSFEGTIRGLHFSRPPYQTAKLISCHYGEIFDVAVDVRVGSKTFGKWVSAIISAENKRSFFVPKGFAHGFCVVSDVADVSYKITGFHHPEHEQGIIFNDSDLNIPWPTKKPILSDKDKKAPNFRDIFKHVR